MYLSGQRSVKLFMSILLRGNEVLALAALCSLCFVLIACAEYLGMVLIYIDYRRQSWKCGIFNVSSDFRDFLLSNKHWWQFGKGNDTDRIDRLVRIFESFG